MNQPSRLLIVEDDPDFAASLGALVASHGYDSQIACSVDEAKEAARQFNPVCVLLDLGLPHRQAGLKLAAWLQEEFKGAMVVIVISGYTTEQDKDDALAHGADYVLGKPLDMRKLRDIIASR